MRNVRAYFVKRRFKHPIRCVKRTPHRGVPVPEVWKEKRDLWRSYELPVLKTMFRKTRVIRKDVQGINVVIFGTPGHRKTVRHGVSAGGHVHKAWERLIRHVTQLHRPACRRLA